MITLHQTNTIPRTSESKVDAPRDLNSNARNTTKYLKFKPVDLIKLWSSFSLSVPSRGHIDSFSRPLIDHGEHALWMQNKPHVINTPLITTTLTYRVPTHFCLHLASDHKVGTIHECTYRTEIWFQTAETESNALYSIWPVKGGHAPYDLLMVFLVLFSNLILQTKIWINNPLPHSIIQYPKK